MSSSSEADRPPQQRPRWVMLVMGLALAVLAGTLTWSALNLRTRVRAQIAGRDAEILEAVTAMQRLDDESSDEALATLDNPAEQFHLALKVSRLRNVIGVRLFSRDGKFVNALPAYISEGFLPVTDLEGLRGLRPVSHYLAQARMADHDLLADTNAAPVPLLLVDVPLRSDDQRRLAGVVQYIMDGSSIARQYAELDWHLALKFSLAFIVSAAILAGGLVLALRRLERANRLLAERTGSLLQANRELALAARTTAVGAIASHLIHGLRNPLSGLRDFVHAHGHVEGDESDPDWQAALTTTQRMQELVNRVVRVLQDQQSGTAYEISTRELMKMLADETKPLAAKKSVEIHFEVAGDAPLSNGDADRILLILENLVQNGIEATPAGGTVSVRVSHDVDAVLFEVRDSGAGLPASMEGRLFTPCVSGKKGGGGIGLAISRQLAQSMGATLRLGASTSHGCVFQLVVTPERAGAGAEHPAHAVAERVET